MEARTASGAAEEAAAEVEAEAGGPPTSAEAKGAVAKAWAGKGRQAKAHQADRDDCRGCQRPRREGQGSRPPR